MFDRIASPSDYSQLVSDQASSIENVAATLISQSSYVSSNLLSVDARSASIVEANNLLYVGNERARIIVWDLARGEEARVLEASGPVQTLKISENRQVLVALDSRGTISCWDLAALGRLSEIHQSSSSCLLHLVNTSVCVASANHKLSVYSFEGDLITQLQFEHIAITAMGGDSAVLLLGGADGQLQFVDPSSFQVSQTVNAHYNAVTHVLMTPTHVVSASTDCTIALTQRHNYGVQVLHVHSSPVASMAITSDFKYLVTCAAQEKIITTSLSTFDAQLEISHDEKNLSALLVSEDSHYIISSSANGLRAWELSNQSDDSYFAESFTPVNAICYSVDNQFLFAASENGLASYDAILANKNMILSQVNTTAVAVTSELVAAGLADGTIQFIAYEDFALLQAYHEHARAIVSLVFRGHLLYSNSEDCIINIWNTEQMELRLCLKVKTGSLMSMTEEWMVCASATSLEIWEVRDPTAPTHWGTVSSHLDVITALEVVENSVISGAADSSIHVVDLKNCKETLSYTCHSAPVVCVKCQKEYEIIISASEDCEVVIWSHIDMLALVRLSIPSQARSLLLQPLYANILCATTDGIYTLKNPVQSDKIIVYPSKYSSLFLYWVSQLLSAQHPNYSSQWKDYILLPMKVSIVHLLTYANHLDGITMALKDSPAMLRSDKGETPLTIAIQRKNPLVIDTILSHVSSSGNSGVWRSIEEVVHLLNQASLPSLPKMYEAAFPVLEHPDLLNFGVLKAEPPTIHLSVDDRIDPSNFLLSAADLRLPEESLEYRQSKLGLNLTAGSAESLLLLSSLRDCDSLAVFSTYFVQSVLTYKHNKYTAFIHFNFVALCLMLLSFNLHNFGIASYFFQIVLLVITIYFICNECLRLYALTIEYFMNISRVCDLFAIILTLLYACLELNGDKSVQTDVVRPMVSFVLWMKFIFKLKLFEYFKPFLLYFELMLSRFARVLLLVASLLITMGVTFTIVNDSSVGDALGMAFETFFSEFSFTKLGFLQILLLVLFCVLIPILLFNMLTAISLESYDYVCDHYAELKYKDIARIVADTELLLVWRRNSGQRMFLQQCSNPSYCLDNRIRPESMKVQLDQYKRMMRRQRKHLHKGRASFERKIQGEIKEIAEEVALFRKEMKRSISNVSK